MKEILMAQIGFVVVLIAFHMANIPLPFTKEYVQKNPNIAMEWILEAVEEDGKK